MHSTYELLHEKVQKYIAKQRWGNFRPIQDDAIHKLLIDKTNLLICAPTASGKTEAAFLPIISSIVNDHSTSIRAIYVSPLKALINDQFRRLNDMCADIGIPVTKWHGDASATQKAKIVENPAGILLITPESLEAILLNKSLSLKKMFSHLDYVVIDEIHSFCGVERGAQLRSILARIEDEAGKTPLRIGLSATIGNPVDVAEWMTTGKCEIIKDEGWRDFTVVGKIRSFTYTLDDEDVKQYDEPHPANAVLCSFINGKNLIFGNSKKILEELSDDVKSRAKEKKINSNYLIHHGSLSKNTRENAEEKIKNSETPVSIFCTSTMEMGLDIGAIEKIGFLDPPWAVSSFAQRLGRSGRREGQPKKFEFFLTQERIHKESQLEEIYREKLVKAIAVVELYLEGILEPLGTKKLNYSTLIHQLLAYVTQKSGAFADDLYRVIVVNGFRDVISKEVFDVLLGFLIDSKFLFKESNGILSGGIKGEKLVGFYDFYSVFMTPKEWNVIYNGDVVGQIPAIVLYVPGDRIILAAKRWDILAVHVDSLQLVVKPGREAKAPKFTGNGGITHKVLHQKMKWVYESDHDISYLDPIAIELLKEARENYKKLNGNSSRIALFEGSIVQNTIIKALKIMDVNFKESECFINIQDNEWKEKLRSFFENPLAEKVIVDSLEKEFKLLEKYDLHLTLDMINHSYILNMLDVKVTREVILELVKK